MVQQTPAPGAEDAEPVILVPVGLPCLERGRLYQKNPFLIDFGFSVFFMTQEWTTWHAWGNCSELCEGGVYSRRRGCTFDGSPVPVSDCTGYSAQSDECNTHECPPPIPCPADYYFAFSRNKSCCKYYNRVYDPDLSPELDGSSLLESDHPMFCSAGDWIQCPIAPLGSTCFSNPAGDGIICLLYTSPSPRDRQKSRMPSSA